MSFRASSPQMPRQAQRPKRGAEDEEGQIEVGVGLGVFHIGQKKDQPDVVAADEVQSFPVFHAHPFLGAVGGGEGEEGNEHIAQAAEDPLAFGLVFSGGDLILQAFGSVL